MNWINLEPKVKDLRERLGELTNIVVQNSKKSDIDVPGSLVAACASILQTDYDIVVCGEVKNGKSSFINAVIGDDILPTNKKVATSQVFRITNSMENKYELVFLDGSRSVIFREQLTRYGSQVDADMNGEPMFQDKVLKYIQVCCPMDFLPEGVSLVDTPGLGALYDAHERITNTYVINAAAVVFIVSPDHPIGPQELAFLEKVYAITPHVLYVMTKRDSYNEDYIAKEVKRDEDILNKNLGELAKEHIEVYPISNKVLAEAGSRPQAAVKEYYAVKSHFAEVKDKLLLMIYRTVGLSRAQFTLSEVIKQITRARFLLSERKQVLSSEGKHVYNALVAKRQKMIETFNKEWGPNSDNQRILNSKISEVCQGIENRLRSLLSVSSAIYQKYESKIDELKSLSEAETFRENFVKDYCRDISSSWEEIVSTGRGQLSAYLSTFNNKMDTAVVASGDNGKIVIGDLSFMEKVGTYRNGFFTGMFADMVLMAIGIPPFGTITALIASIFIGIDERARRRLEMAKSQFKVALQRAAVKLQTDLCVSPALDTGYSALQKVVKETREEAIRARDEVYNSQKDRLERELQALKDDMEKDADERCKAIEKVTECEQAWNNVNTLLTPQKEALSMLAKELCVELSNELSI